MFTSGGVIMKATSSSDEPPSLYVLQQAAQFAVTNPDTAQQLIKRLKKDEVNIKWKSLRTMRHCCTARGSSGFRRVLQRNGADVIKQHAMYKGQPHPLKGDQPSRMVREEATLCLQALFNSEDALASDRQMGSERQMEGFGNVPAGANLDAPTGLGGLYAADSTPGSFTGGSRITGFGNTPSPAVKDYTPTGGTVAQISEAVYSVGSALKPAVGTAASSVAAVLGSVGTHVGAAVESVVQRGRGGISYRKKPPPSDAAAMGEEMNGSRFCPLSLPQDRVDPPSYTWKAIGGLSSSGTSITSSVPLEKPEVVAKTAGGAVEQRLVDEICQPGGAKIAVPKETLASFVYKLAVMAPDARVLTLRQLINRLDSKEKWQSNLRVLCILAAVMEDAEELLDKMGLSGAEDIRAALKEEVNADPERLRLVAKRLPQCRMKVADILCLSAGKALTSRPTSMTRSRGVPTPSSEARPMSLLDDNEPEESTEASHIGGRPGSEELEYSRLSAAEAEARIEMRRRALSETESSTENLLDFEEEESLDACAHGGGIAKVPQQGTPSLLMAFPDDQSETCTAANGSENQPPLLGVDGFGGLEAVLSGSSDKAGLVPADEAQTVGDGIPLVGSFGSRSAADELAAFFPSACSNGVVDSFLGGDTCIMPSTALGYVPPPMPMSIGASAQPVGPPSCVGAAPVQTSPHSRPPMSNSFETPIHPSHTDFQLGQASHIGGNVPAAYVFSKNTEPGPSNQQEDTAASDPFSFIATSAAWNL